MPKLLRAMTGGLGVSDLVALAAQDAVASQNGFYWTDDMLGTSPILTTNLGTGAFFYTYGTINPSPLPNGWTVANMQGHPGLLSVRTSALNDVGAGVVSPSQQPFTVNAGSANLTWNCIFAIPPQASTASDRYQFIVGMLQMASSYPTSGFGLSYVDNVNSGNWNLMEFQSANIGPNIIASASVGPTPGSWYKATITVKGAVVTASINGAQICSGNSSVLNGNASSGMNLTPLGCWMNRSTFSAGERQALVDRVSMYMTAVNR